MRAFDINVIEDRDGEMAASLTLPSGKRLEHSRLTDEECAALETLLGGLTSRATGGDEARLTAVLEEINGPHPGGRRMLKAVPTPPPERNLDRELLLRLRSNPTLSEEMPHIERRANECTAAAVASPERWEARAAFWADLSTLLSLQHQPDELEWLRTHPGVAAIIQAAREEAESLQNEADDLSASAEYRANCREGAAAWRKLLAALGET